MDIDYSNVNNKILCREYCKFDHLHGENLSGTYMSRSSKDKTFIFRGINIVRTSI